MEKRIQVSPFKEGLIGFGFDNPLTAEVVCQVVGRDPKPWSNKLVVSYNNTYSAGIDPNGVAGLLHALQNILLDAEPIKGGELVAIPKISLSLIKNVIKKAKLNTP